MECLLLMMVPPIHVAESGPRCGVQTGGVNEDGDRAD